VHHVTLLTEDMDRLLAFYVRVFDAEVTLDMTEDGLRHAFLRVGPKTVLHPFQMLDGPGPPPPSPMFRRGRMDPSRCWHPTRQRSGSCVSGSRRRARPTATFGDMNSHRIMGYFDPDGAAHEVMLERQDSADADMLERAEWRTVELDD
jgi:catechol 2,3-dioxygenase-like lactoylglutathione lyase family enzyme